MQARASSCAVARASKHCRRRHAKEWAGAPAAVSPPTASPAAAASGVATAASADAASTEANAASVEAVTSVEAAEVAVTSAPLIAHSRQHLEPSKAQR